MADLVPVAAAVLATGTAKKRQIKFGETVTPGQALYDAGTSNLKLAQADALATAEFAGVSLNGGNNGQPGEIITEGDYNPGVAVVPGTTYCVSAAAPGGVAPDADIISPNIKSVIGVATTISNIHISRNNSGAAIP